MEHAQRFQHYLTLIDQPYATAVSQLQALHGPVKDDYFLQASYEQFLAGRVLRLQRGNYSRTRDGLCTHHVAENRFSNMSDAPTIKRLQYPFRFQQRDQLVYVDEVEHLILHALITKETHGQFGYHGYREYLSKDVWDWYVDRHVPQKNWRHRCYGVALISPTEARYLFGRLNAGPLAKINAQKPATF
ncbi:hypothetical protein D1831_05195 [Lactiplantibacillus garii]|uniref:Uncharacterized protein n=1 Tax=Lactiplantibacillus garii TaxID=2306423 RepID=A0A3R8QRW1_9LACO|nr:hypothetical protein [Lactiplantibacillus garii]RRK10828.1 hypothetical protein D1831_05195 [Lactiplantibacillus garii]